MKTGLVSVTFRKLTPRAIVALVKQAALDGIEWGGDVHVPPGDLGNAADVAAMTRNAGLAVAAYGSYYRLGHPDSGPFEDVLAAAGALGAPIIRLWAGKTASAEATPEYRESVAADGHRIADLAAKAEIKIALEWHANTLADTAESCVKLFESVNHPDFLTYWQPRNLTPETFCLEDMEAALPRLIGLHVFHWDEQTRERLSLDRGADRWRSYLAKAAAKAGSDMFALIEFVAGDEPEQFLYDAATLKTLVAELETH